MRILFVLPRLHPNQHAWCQALTDAGHEVCYLVAQQQPNVEDYSCATPTLAEQQPAPWWWRWPVSAYLKLTAGKVRPNLIAWPKRAALVAYLRATNPDVVIVREATLPLSFAVLRYCQEHQVPTLLYTQYPLEVTDSWTIRLLRWWGLAPAVRITPNRLNREHTEQIATNTHYVPLVSDWPVIPIRRSNPSSPINILCVAKYASRRKRHGDLIRALSQLPNQERYHLTFIGNGKDARPAYWDQLHALARTCGVAAQITWLEDIDPTQVEQYFRAADVFVLPSAHEAFAISPIQALNCGVPVIVTDTSGGQSNVTNGKNGYVIPTGDVAALADRIVEVTKNPAVREQMAAHALAFYEAHLTPQRFLAHITPLLKRVTTQPE